MLETYLGGEKELSQTNRSVRGAYTWGLRPVSNQSSRAPWEEALVARPNPGPHDNEKSCVKVQGDTGKRRRHGICGMPGMGVSQGDTMRVPVWRETFLQEPEIA